LMFLHITVTSLSQDHVLKFVEEEK
jgi:hypothetical protein